MLCWMLLASYGNRHSSFAPCTRLVRDCLLTSGLARYAIGKKSMRLWWPTVSIDRSIGMASQIKKWSQVGGWAGDGADLCPKRHLSGQPIAGHHASRPYQTDTHAHRQGKGPRQFICPCLYLIQANSKFSNSSSTHHSHLKTRPWTASSSVGSHLASISLSKYRRSSGQEM